MRSGEPERGEQSSGCQRSLTSPARITRCSPARSALLLVAPLAIAAITAGTVPAATAGSPVLAAAQAPLHTLTVSGTGVGMYPAYSGAVERYGVTTSAATGGT